MIFTTWTYAAFLTIVVALYWLIPSNNLRASFLIFTGIIFYTFQVPVHTILILGITIIVYYISIAILDAKTRKSKKGYFILGVVISLLVLGYFKYWKMVINTYNILVEQLALERAMLLPEVYILVPLAISFFTFEYIHYLTDLYQGKITNRSFKDFLLFIVFFPTLVSGPIKRFQEFNDQTDKGFRFSFVYLSEGSYRILIGLAKKLIIADGVSTWADRLLSPGHYDSLQLWIAVFAYSVKIYFDFSGYSDIAIGSARLFGYKVPENFNHPYLKTNISSFWRSWHMSLSNWIRDYLFIPLGGSRGNRFKVFITFVFVMGVVGLWHGASWNFVIWGLYHGFGSAVYSIYKNNILKGRKVKGNWFSNSVATLFTFLFVSLGWVLFAVTSLGQAIEVYQKIFYL